MLGFGRARFILLFWAVILLLGGCTPSTITPTSLIEPTTTAKATSTAVLPEPQATLTPTQYAPTASPSSVKARATDTPALPPENILIYQPLEIAPALPPDVKPAGALLISPRPLHLLRFDPNVTVEPFELGNGSDLSVSPDGKWLAYVQLSDSSTTGQWLIVESADRLYQYTVPFTDGPAILWQLSMAGQPTFDLHPSQVRWA